MKLYDSDYNGVVGGYFKYRESEESIEKRGGDSQSQSQLNVGSDGKYYFSIYRGSSSNRVSCASNELAVTDDIRSYTWDCQGDNVNMDMSCGCFQEKLSGGEIAGIVIGVAAFLVIVATALAIYFRLICRYKSKEIITSLHVDEPVIVVV